jgi:XTP/dITP diphosphohydrolase
VPDEPPGSRLLDVVKIIDVLVSPGGDPWKRQQTHASLARYLLEEAYEAYDAIQDGDLAALKEELGDVLLQVVLHARMAQEAAQPWSIDDVAQVLAEKMVRRNPHVFAGTPVSGLDEITANWERIKQQEKPRRAVLDGVVFSQPALSLAAKVLARARSAGIDVPLAPPPVEVTTEEELGEVLFALVAAASAKGLDAEAALRRAVRHAADTLTPAVRSAQAVLPEEAVRSAQTALPEEAVRSTQTALPEEAVRSDHAVRSEESGRPSEPGLIDPIA